MPLFLDDRYENVKDNDDQDDDVNDDDDEESKFIRRIIYECFTGYNWFIGDVASWSAPHDWTVADVYMSVTKDIVDAVRYYMRLFSEREGLMSGGASSSSSSSAAGGGGLPVAYSLYKLADYFMPLVNINRASTL